MKTSIRSYHDLLKLQTFDERYRYLKLSGAIGKETFGVDRYLNQRFYQSAEWRRIRDMVIIRDCGYDLGIEGCEIRGRPTIHHMNPVSIKDILERTDILLNPEYLITVSHDTHNAIHYGDDNLLTKQIAVRTPFDTCPWKKGG